MSDLICTGVITKLQSGRFDGQFDIEITQADGSKYQGANGLSAYETKKDGTQSAVWPTVQESFLQKKPFTWLGNFRESETKAGPRTYATVTYAQVVDPAEWDSGVVETNGNGFGEQPAGFGSKPQAKPQAQPKAKKQDVDWDERTAEIEAGWAIKVAIQMLNNPDEAAVLDMSRKLIAAKHQLAQELLGGRSEAHPQPLKTSDAAPSPSQSSERPPGW